MPQSVFMNAQSLWQTIAAVNISSDYDLYFFKDQLNRLDQECRSLPSRAKFYEAQTSQIELKMKEKSSNIAVNLKVDPDLQAQFTEMVDAAKRL